MEWIIIALCALSALLSICTFLAVLRRKDGGNASIDRATAQLQQEIRSVRQENTQAVQHNMLTLGELLKNTQSQTAQMQDKRLSELTQQLKSSNDTLQRTVSDGMRAIDARFVGFSQQTEQKLEQLRTGTDQRLEAVRATMEQRIAAMQKDNAQQLEQMRMTVDEKLQKTLEERIGQSFKLVSERLEQVYKGLGEMQTLAMGVGDLKKVLSGVKTRGILGEIQLGAILEQILPPEQYETNVVTKRGSGNPVEYAIKLPGDDDGVVYLPIDAKFPADVYSALLDAYDTADPQAIEAAQKALSRTIRTFAKSIRDKYIDPPHTTDFGIMFLPFEGLYAEVVRNNLVETLQRDYHINIAGPTTMAALLNSLQMGFRTLAIQKHSSEVWNVLGAVKTEFNKFGDVLAATQKQLENANARLETLVGVRTRQIQRKLRSVEQLPEAQSVQLLELTGLEQDEESEDE